MDSVNGRLKLLRSAVCMSQTEFGSHIDASQNYLSNMEKGYRDVTEKIIKIICLQPWNGKRVNESWLRTGEGGNENMFIQDFLEDEYMTYATEIGNDASDIVKKAIVKYGRLSADDRKIIDNALALAVKMIKEE